MPTVEVRDVRVVDDALRTALLDCWTDVVNAGGAVGFVPPVTRADVAPWLDATLARVREGRDALCLLEVDGEPAGFAFLVPDDSPLKQHWCTVHRVQVHPSRQGRGLGSALVRGVAEVARQRGWEFLLLTVRGATGTEAFYAGLGFTELARLPGVLRLGPGDDREEIWMRLAL